MRIFRLHWTLPEGSEVPGWKPDCELRAGDLGARWEHDDTVSFTWPLARRNFLSRTAAFRRADTLRRYGAYVTVEISEHVRWPSEAAS
jgi:hypothetical protein